MAKRFTYDKKTKRFRDSSGHFISRERGLRSKYARAEYERATRQKVRRRKGPAVKHKPAKVIKQLPSYNDSPVLDRKGRVVRGQRRVLGISRWGVNSLANLILEQINAGYHTFRFWYKIVKQGFIYTDTTSDGSKIGSTWTLDYSYITRNKTLDEVIRFLEGRQNIINGKVIYYWYSKR